MATQIPPSIVDRFGSKLTISTTVRALVWIWLAPAAASIWVAGGSIGVWPADPSQVARVLELTQAFVILLALATGLFGAIWAVRTWTSIPPISGIEGRWWVTGPAGHLMALGVTSGALLMIAAFSIATQPLWWVTALSACLAGLFLARWLCQVRTIPSSTMARFSGSMVVQLTIGWLPLLHRSGELPVILVAIVGLQGLILAGTAAGAARIVPEFGLRNLRLADAQIEPEEAVEGVSPAPAQRSLPEPAVGH